MEMGIKHFVEEYWIDYYYEGYISEIESREEYLNDILKDNCFIGFRFYDREVIKINGKEYVGEPINYSSFIKVLDSLDDNELLGHTMDIKPEDKAKVLTVDTIVHLDDYIKEVLGRGRSLK